MKIIFLLPCLIKIPMGGIKVIYRYAEELAKIGHNISIISPLREGNKIFDYLKYFIISLRDIYHNVKNHPYYQTSQNVKHYIIPVPTEEHIPDADIIFATGWQTANWVIVLPKSKGKKFYFIQGMEVWLTKSEKIIKTWKFSLTKVVIADWLKYEIKKIGEPVYGPIQNAIDKKEFFITKPINKRKYSISMLYHRHPIKGAKEGILVLKKIKKLYPDTNATIFSSRKPKLVIPSWIKIEIRPTISKLREIYNSSTIFIHPSYTEGWPLPPAESMMCGCAVVATANKGIQEYITHNESGLLSPIGNVDSMVENIQYLLDNPMERIRIAIKGQKTICQFSWEKSTKHLEKILTRAI